MKTILRQDIPTDFTYYRSASRVFYEYFRRSLWIRTHIVEGKYGFLRGRRILGFLPFWSVFLEKIDTEPTREILTEAGFGHGIIFWIPHRRTDMPKGWRRASIFLTKSLIHASRSAFIRIDDTPEYWKKWSTSARGHRNKIQRLLSDGIMSIERATPEDFFALYRDVKLRDPFQKYVVHWCKRGLFIPEIQENLRVYFGRVDGEVVAGAVFIDEGVTSEYFTSFYLEASKPYHMGVALLDRWMADSRKMGIKYCDLDHMWDTGYPSSQKGYTTFKSGIAEYDVYFRDMWIKFF